MSDNALIRILTALFKHQVKKLVGEDTLGVIGEELTSIGGDKLDEQVKLLLGEKSTTESLEKAAEYVRATFSGKVNDEKVEQWMVMLPLDNLPSIVSAIEELPTSPDESKLEKALYETISLNWANLSAEQVNNAVNSYLSCLRSALLPIEKHTLTVIGRTVLRTEDKVDLLIRLFDKYIVNSQDGFKKNSAEKRQKDKTAKKYDEEIPQTDTIVKEGKFLQIVVSQMFRLADLLTYPEGVKAKKFYETITDSNKYRRFLNRRNSFDLKPYGVLRPVITIGEQFDIFWKPAIPDFRKDIDPLRFIPFELDLSNHLRYLTPDPGSVLESVLKGDLHLITNLQINGGLRIYPPGTGIISMKLTLEFKEGIHVEISGELARNIENLLFIDPGNSEDVGKPSQSIFLEIIDTVAQTFFKDEMFIGAERRWQPPETMYIFRDFHGENLDEKVNVLSRLLSYAPANNEDLEVLKRRVIKSLNLSHWQRDKIFSCVSEGVALVIIPVSEAVGKKESQKRLMEFFVNTRELITAAEYSLKAFTERLDQINNDYMNDQISDEEVLEFLQTMQRVLLAISSIKEHLHKFNKGELMTFAKDLWHFDNPIDFDVFYKNLNSIRTISSDKKRKSNYISEIQNIIDKVKQLPSPFPGNRKQNFFRN